MFHVTNFCQGNMAASNQRNLSIIVLKLTAIMGITLDTGTCTGFLLISFLEYPFVILNSFQG